MRATLFLSVLASALAQTTPAEWKFVIDSKGVCQIAVPADGEPLPETTGAAVFHDVTTAIAVVTSQAGQAFKSLTETFRGCSAFVRTNFSRIRRGESSIRTRFPSTRKTRTHTAPTYRVRAARAVVTLWFYPALTG
jgi:hypothetical protein